MKHPQKIKPLELHIPYSDIFAFDNNFIVEHSETPDSRPIATKPAIETHTTADHPNIQIHDSNELHSDTSESQVLNPQQDPQTKQPMTQQQPNIQLEHLSLQPNENPNSDHNQNDLLNPNPIQSPADTVDSNATLVL